MFGRDKDATRAARRRKTRAKPGATKRTSESLPDLRKPGVRRIPWDDLTPEEQRGIEELKQADERWYRQHPDWSIMWTGGRALDRAAALEKWGPLPEKQRSKRKKSRGRVGRPPDYQGETIQQIARDYIKNVGLSAAPRSKHFFKVSACLRQWTRITCDGSGGRSARTLAARAQS